MRVVLMLPLVVAAMLIGAVAVTELRPSCEERSAEMRRAVEQEMAVVLADVEHTTSPSTSCEDTLEPSSAAWAEIHEWRNRRQGTRFLLDQGWVRETGGARSPDGRFDANTITTGSPDYADTYVTILFSEVATDSD